MTKFQCVMTVFSMISFRTILQNQTKLIKRNKAKPQFALYLKQKHLLMRHTNWLALSVEKFIALLNVISYIKNSVEFT